MARPAASPVRSRQSLAARRRAARASARERLAGRTAHPVSETRRAADPTDHRRLGPAAALAAALGFLLAAAAVHGGVIGGGVLVALLVPDAPEKKDKGPVAIEVRERAPKPPEVSKVEVPEQPKVEQPKVVKEVPKMPRTEPDPMPTTTPPDTPEPPLKAPPRRVVGLSLDNTAQTGGGAAFATGNSRAGETARTAEDPNKIPRDGSAGGPATEPSPNKAATRIPTAGGKVILPKRKKPIEPVYPPDLEAQGIEANVPVLVSIDTSGRVTDVKILKASPYPALDEAARQAALAEEFEPAMRDGVAIPYTLSYTYRFRIEES